MMHACNISCLSKPIKIWWGILICHRCTPRAGPLTNDIICMEKQCQDMDVLQFLSGLMLKYESVYAWRSSAFHLLPFIEVLVDYENVEIVEVVVVHAEDKIRGECRCSENQELKKCIH